MTAPQLAALFQEIVDLTERVHARNPAPARPRLKLLPPGSREHIALMGERVPAPIPPSYVSFLELHDGCTGFWGNLTLLGTKGPPRKRIAELIQEAVRVQAPEVLLAGGGTAITPEAIAAFERTGQFYVPAHAVFGAGEGGRCLLFNHHKLDSSGEPEVVDWAIAGKVLARHENFEAFLRATRDELARQAG